MCFKSQMLAKLTQSTCFLADLSRAMFRILPGHLIILAVIVQLYMHYWGTKYVKCHDMMWKLSALQY